MRKARGTPSRLKQFVWAPVRVLRRLRDMYIRVITGCADRVQCSSASVVTLACPLVPTQFPHCNSIDDDLRQLISAAELRMARTSHSFRRDAPSEQAVSRSRSTLATRRIDEDQVCEFEDDFEVGSDRLLIPRSRSFAVGRKRRGAARVEA